MKHFQTEISCHLTLAVRKFITKNYNLPRLWQLNFTTITIYHKNIQLHVKHGDVCRCSLLLKKQNKMQFFHKFLECSWVLINQKQSSLDDMMPSMNSLRVTRPSRSRSWRRKKSIMRALLWCIQRKYRLRQSSNSKFLSRSSWEKKC